MTSLTSEELDQRITQSIAHATAELRDEFRAQLHEIRRGLDSRLLVDGLRSIDAADTQAEVLKALLVATEPYSRGAAILLATPDGLRGWGMRGIQGSQGIESVELAVNGSGPWSRCLGGEGVVRGSISDLYSALGTTSNEEHTLVPIVLRGQVAAVLATDGEEDVPALQALTYGASQAIETLVVRKDGPSPTLRVATAGDAAAAPAAGPPAAPAMEPAAVPVAEVATPAPAPAPTQAEPPQPVVEVAPDAGPPAAPALDPTPEPSPFQDDLRTVAVTPESVAAAQAPMEPPAEPAPAAEVAPPSGGAALAVGADGQIVPPDDVEGPGWAFSNSAPAEAEAATPENAYEDEARRLARLLVSEIKLYNEEQVEEGRQNGNVYARLREDIDRSQQIYEERIHPSIRGKTSFFRDELARILAAGDSSLLGM